MFLNQEHGFAHIGLAANTNQDNWDDQELFVDNEFGGTGRVTLHSGEAEVVACLLSTTWMETYSRVFLPTVGPLVSKDKGDAEWQELEMMDIRKAESRDVRQEIKNALDDFEAVTNGQKMDRFDAYKEVKLRLCTR